MKASSLECVLALDAGGTSIKLGIVPVRAVDGGSAGSGVLDFQEVPVHSDGSAAGIEAAYGEAARIGVACAARRGFRLAGVGVSTPGPFDYENGQSLMNHKYAAIKGIGIRPFIESQTGKLPIRFIHDSSAFLLGELALGAWSLYRAPCAAIIGTGLGFAAISEGRLLRNPQGGPGISIFRTPCRGGIVEDFVSKRGIMRCYVRLSASESGDSSSEGSGSCDPGGLSVKEIARAAVEGNPLCIRVFEETGTILADILAPVILEHGFDCLILGGQIAKSGPLLTVPAQKRLDSLGLACAVVTARRIDEAPCLGAARSFLDGEASV